MKTFEPKIKDSLSITDNKIINHIFYEKLSSRWTGHPWARFCKIGMAGVWLLVRSVGELVVGELVVGELVVGVLAVGELAIVELDVSELVWHGGRPGMKQYELHW